MSETNLPFIRIPSSSPRRKSRQWKFTWNDLEQPRDLEVEGGFQRKMGKPTDVKKVSLYPTRSWMDVKNHSWPLTKNERRLVRGSSRIQASWPFSVDTTGFCSLST